MPIQRVQTPPPSPPETITVTQKLRKRVESKWITPYWTVLQTEYHVVENSSVYCVRTKYLVATEDSDPIDTFILTSINRNSGTDLETAIFGVPDFKEEDAHTHRVTVDYFTIPKFVEVPELGRSS